MGVILRKEWAQFFNGLTGYLILSVFLLLNGLFLFVFPETSLLDAGYASLDGFFTLCPWILLVLAPAVTMRSFPEEYRSGTYELVRTWPVSPARVMAGKFLGCTAVIAAALLPTLLYAVALQYLSQTGGLDIGSAIGSYVGLLLLGAAFTAIGLFTGSFGPNMLAALILGVFVCLIMYSGFEAIGNLPSLGSAGYYISMLGLRFHYKSISRGVLDIRDLLYFSGVIVLFLMLTARNFKNYNR